MTLIDSAATNPPSEPPLVEAVVSLDAFAANVAHIRNVIAPAELMVVVKADAYGNGAVRIAQRAEHEGIRLIGALDLDTALALRAAGVGTDILAWLHASAADFAPGIRARIDLGVSSRVELQRIAAAALELAADADFVPPRLHLKIDTGLNRNGCPPELWPGLVAAALEAQHAGLVDVYAVWTHIAEASEDEDTLALERFLAAVDVARGLGADIRLRHLAASSAGLRRADVRLDLVRMGGHCWGIPSFDGVTPAEIGLTPIMTLRARVGRVIDAADGSRRALVTAGYGDGVPRHVASKVAVAVSGVLLPVLAVERDYLVLDADALPGIAVGDRAVLFGTGAEGEQTVRQWGDLSGTLGDEITARIAARVPRRYPDGDPS